MYRQNAKYSECDVNNDLRSADTLSNHIYKLTQESPSKLNEILKEPVENDAVCMSRDMWTNKYRRISYLEMIATFVNR